MTAFIHESSYVEEDVSIGDGTHIWHFCHIMPGARIGKGCNIGQNVFIDRGVRIGDGVKIQNNVSVYTGVELGDYVFCGPSCVFTNVINPRSHIERKDEFRPIHVGHHATIGANATIVCGNNIGEYAFVAAGAVVTRYVQPFWLVAGVPARCVGFMDENGDKADESWRS